MRRLVVGAATAVGGVLVGVVVGVIVSATSPANPVSALDGLDTTGTATYTVDFGAGVVRAQVELSFVNSVPNQIDGDIVSTTFFTGVQYGVQGDATSVSGRAGDRPLDVSLIPGDANGQIITIDFGENLDYGEQLDVVITWDLPGLAPRSELPWRSNEAFVSFSGYAYGDPGASTVRIVTPVDAAVALPQLAQTGTPEPELSSDGVVEVRTFAGVGDPGNFGAFVVASNDVALTETMLDVAGRQVVLQSWPDDAEWTGFVGAQMSTGLVELERLIGLPIRDEREIVVRESVNPLLEGFAGWYDASTGIIEIGEVLDPALMLHELSHAWFNGELSGARWITEGLAETYANLALAGTGGTPVDPAAPTAGQPGAQSLDAWAHPNGLQPDEEIETYGYETSHYVLDAVVDEIGPPAMAAVLAAIEGDLEAYRGEGEPGPAPTETDWRRFLDLVEEVGGATVSSDLFDAYVVAEADRALLAERAAARSEYTALAADASSGEDGAWTVPDVVRHEMEEWDFAVANASIDAAEAVLAARDVLDDVAQPASLELPEDLEARYEGATTESDLRSLSTDLSELTGAATAVVDAEAAADAERSTLQVLGLDGKGFDTELAQARAAVADGEAEVAQRLAGDVVGELAEADELGVARANEVADTAVDRWWIGAIAVAAGLLLAGIVTLVLNAARRGRSRGVGAQLDARCDPPVDGDVQLGVGRRVDLDEDALAGTRLGGVNGVLHPPHGHPRQGPGAPGIVEDRTALGHVGDPVLQLDEDVGTVVDAHAVPGAEVLVDPDAHGRHQR